MNAAVCCNAVRIGIGEAGIGILLKMKIILLPKVVCGEWRPTFLLLPDCGEVYKIHPVWCTMYVCVFHVSSAENIDVVDTIVDNNDENNFFDSIRWNVMQ